MPLSDYKIGGRMPAMRKLKLSKRYGMRHLVEKCGM
jgi:hypothetical protein